MKTELSKATYGTNIIFSLIFVSFWGYVAGMAILNKYTLSLLILSLIMLILNIIGIQNISDEEEDISLQRGISGYSLIVIILQLLVFGYAAINTKVTINREWNPRYIRVVVPFVIIALLFIGLISLNSVELNQLDSEKR